MYYQTICFLRLIFKRCNNANSHFFQRKLPTQNPLTQFFLYSTQKNYIAPLYTIMKKYILLTAVFAFIGLSQSFKTDEGMFPLSELKNINLKKIGLKIKPIELYNPNGVSIMDAIVRVGGCTGSFVSNDGLIVTNHHCAFSFVAAISDSNNNYIQKGYLANNKGEEAQAKGLVCKIAASYEDVSGKVLQGTQGTNDAAERLKIIAGNLKTIVEAENKANPTLSCEISEMFTGRTYVLFRYKLLKDVRLVYVPARSIGEYGGEKDNWVWPRHSGDFAFLRAYVAPDGSAAEYSPNNIPYKPAKHLTINPKGVNENDFVFILGYPGRTYRHQPAAFYKYHEQYMLQYISSFYDWQIEEMEKLGKGNVSLQIKYASRIKQLANTTKNFKGKLQGFKRVKLTAKKYADEKLLQDFLSKDETLKATYSQVIPRINVLFDDIMKYAPRNLWYDQIYNVAPTLSVAAAVDNFKTAFQSLKSDAEKNEFKLKQSTKLKQVLAAAFSKYDEAFELAVMEKMLDDAKKFNTANKVSALEKLSDIKAIYANSAFKDSKNIEKLANEDIEKLFALSDPLLDFAHNLNQEINFFDDEDRKREAELNQLMAKYVDAKSVFQNKSFVPDANATLRFTYGYVKGYSPNDAEYHAPFTSLSGVVQKEDGVDYELLPIIKELHAAKEYGNLLKPDMNEVPVNFLYNLDTTGGNSGSPVMNAKGELVGINFDRAYTATINDYAWNESYSRSVGVDIRYVLWIVQKVAKADNLMNELGQK